MQILLGLKDIHQHYIVHRDLKLKNIFVDSGLNCIIGDLGISSQSVNSTNSILGTYGYQAPEVYSFDSEGYNDKIDMWAIGIIAFQMFNRKVNGHLRYPFGTLEYLYDKLKDTSPAEFISKYR